MPTWPASLPFFSSRSGANRQVSGGQLRSEMDFGPDKVRRRTSTTPQSRSGRMAVMTKPELDAFEAFFSVTLGEGALSFDALDTFDDTTRDFRFLGGYSVERWGDFFSVTAELEILP
ncbi:hypothetical protein [Salipiger bermudensis]|uniref:hypothetical protein n=1 Tax=Salipiger bermudensis TaxID=344736 RepID=UPI001A903FE3|nr:hypothetical protein [Salipiger bermudensis]MBN9674646.1 hypothetical protein [Salipiger bermudensis]